jgi:hypothetical protein
MTNIEATQNPTSKSITAERHAYRFHVSNLHLQSVFGDDWFALKAEAFARFFGTPSFLIAQTVIVAVWILINVLGGVDGFDQDKGTGERDEGSKVLCRLLAAQGDALEALDLADALLGASAPLVEDLGKESRLGGSILAVRDGGADAAPARRLSVGLGVVTLIAENRSRGDVRADVEQDLEVAAVAGLATGQVEGQR